ncbi:hypothetical protein [Rothia uropygialis]|uniref:hypothetical protein n=1 Tax=Kocuria sp. 36 TaxID=1415402 RepID=UPI00101DE953|nr:hypothetical protein [Kocuria sp. 36]
MNQSEYQRGHKQLVLVLLLATSAAAAVIIIGSTVLVPKFSFFAPWVAGIWAVIVIWTLILERGTLFHRDQHRTSEQ